MSNSVFSRQLRFATALVDSCARLTAEAVLHYDYDYVQLRARIYAKAKKFRSSEVWHSWKCSTYGIFVLKFINWSETDV